MHTLRSLADFIADLDRRNGEERDQIHSQLRNLYAKGLIIAERERGAGKTAAVLVSPTESARARILTTLIDLGFDASIHRVVNDALDRPVDYLGSPPKSARIKGAIISNGGLRDALRGIALKENWTLRIDLFRHGNGEREITARMVWPEIRDLDSQSEKVNHLYQRQPLATVTLPLSNLLAAFVGAQ